MYITEHAGERFLERVMKKEEYTRFDTGKAIDFLTLLLKDVVPRNYIEHFALPCFENFRVIYKDHSVVTIVPKNRRRV